MAKPKPLMAKSSGTDPAHAAIESALRTLDAEAGGVAEPGYGLSVIPVKYVSGATLSRLMEGFAARPGAIRTDPSGRLLVAASIQPLQVREGTTIKTLSAGLTVFRMGRDGKLTFARKYYVDVGSKTQFWSGMVRLA